MVLSSRPSPITESTSFFIFDPFTGTQKKVPDLTTSRPRTRKMNKRVRSPLPTKKIPMTLKTTTRNEMIEINSSCHQTDSITIQNSWQSNSALIFLTAIFWSYLSQRVLESSSSGTFVQCQDWRIVIFLKKAWLYIQMEMYSREKLHNLVFQRKAKALMKLYAQC